MGDNRHEEPRKDDLDLLAPYHTLDERNEEIAGELTADDINEPVDSSEKQTEMDEHDGDVNHGLGWFALALSVLAFFWMPIILGAAGIIVGFTARHRNAATLGNIAIVAGIIAIIGRLFVVPFS